MAETPDIIKELVDRYDSNRDLYRSDAYNEEQARAEFINPFFEALGWDVTNKDGNSPAYMDVVFEGTVRVEGAANAPDYTFRVGQTRKFFVEAKKPRVSINFDQEPARQIRRYSWTAKLPLGVLTNFHEFAVYDCRIPPKPSDKAAYARLTYITYKDYVNRWEEIARIFSKDAVWKGSFDRYAASEKGKRGTAEVDQEFLKQIEEWRTALARNLALRNQLDARELNYAVQNTIDRIVFLRICEDRGIEPHGQLFGRTSGPNVYGRLVDLYLAADAKYNSGLFHFYEEKGRAEAPDTLTTSLKIDDKVLRDIIAGLYYPKSPYEFSVIGADILGSVYEQFLGKVITLPSPHRAVVDAKPEVKKAGGVYYTPTYIVDYIVKNTVGKLCQGKTAKQVEKLQVLDPACGSGSFLINAYAFLLNWHLDYYVKDDPKKHKKEVYRISESEWRLTTKEKKRILLNNIYGVDIDSQAVEVTKLSLLLKVLEGESADSLQMMLNFSHERALPDLAANIKCGNSLIGTDFDTSGLSEEEISRINPFDWDKDLPEIMSKGGFDAVIGNPPYGFHQIHDASVKPYFKNHYVSSSGSFEHYFLFYEASLRLLKHGGYHGFIVPVTWLTIPSAESLRRFILDNCAIRHIAWLPELVFRNAQVNTLVSIIQRANPDTTGILISEVNDPALGKGTHRTMPQSSFVTSGYVIHIFESPQETKLLEKMEENGIFLGTIAKPCSGYNPYEVGKGIDPSGKPHGKQTIEQRPYHASSQLGPEWKPEAVGRDLDRFVINWPGNRFVKYGPWLAAPRDPDNYIGPRLLVQEITGGPDRRIVAAYCDKELYHSRDIIPIKFDKPWPDPRYVLGILNSRIITWRHHRRSPKAKKQLFPKVLVSDLRKLPLPRRSADNAEHRMLHDKMVKLVDRMLHLHKKLDAAKLPNDKTRIQRRIDATDREIDALVYDLYDLTEDEIKIVEEAV